jgi:Tfp pilus assembly pilus retraction ATPase PilT
MTMSSSEYDMTDLLTLILSERADGLSLHAGMPPVVHLHAEPHTVEGPAITPENAESLLRSLAGTRQVRQLRAAGGLEFVYTFRDVPFRVQVRAEDENVCVDLQRVKVQPGAGPNDEERDGL